MEDKLSIKESLKISKIYTKYYLNHFTPITVYEKKHQKNLYNLHNYYITIGFGVSFVFLYRGYAYYQTLYLIRNNRSDQVLSKGYLVLNMIMFYMVGLQIGKLLSYSNLYSQTNYIRKRLSHEDRLKVDRKIILENNNNSLYEDYPFIDENKLIYSDTVEEQNRLYIKNN
jgi:hypothetical protein